MNDETRDNRIEEVDEDEVYVPAGWAWTGANFWRAALERFHALDHGRTAFLGSHAVWIGSVVALVSMAGVGVALWVTVHRDADERA